MGFNRFTKNVLNISGLPDRVQNKAATLKALFDQAGVDIKDALNGLIAELEASTGAGNIGANVPTVTTKTVQAILTAFEESILDRYTKGEIDALVSGNTNNLVEDVDINLTTGVITVTKKDGTVEKYDTAIEKVPAKFEITQSGNTYYLKITNVDGTSTQTDITKLMNIYEFSSTNDIAFTVEGTGNKKTVKANIRANSIGLDKLSVSVVSTLEGYMNSAKDSANSAKSSENSARNSAETARKAAEVASEGIEAGKTAVKKATEAESYAHGGTGTRENEDRDNAKYYSQVAKEVSGGNFVTVTEMETYAQKKGTVPSFEGEVVSGEEIEVDVPVEVESILHISGNSVQDSRSGKNILPQDNFTTAQTINGVTFTPNSDGSIKISGTSTASAYLWLTYNLLPKLVIGKTYTIGIGQEMSSNLRMLVEEAKVSSWVANIANQTIPTWKFNGLTTGDKVRVSIGVGAGVTVDTTIYPQIEEGSTATSYEPYGVKPSPEFESPIMSVKSKSDNLFDISKKKDNTSFVWASGVEYTPSEGSVFSDYMPLDGINEIISNYGYDIAFYNNNKSYLGNGDDVTTAAHSSYKHIVIPNNPNIAYCRLAWKKNKANGNIDMTTVTDIMLNKGSVALPYQPYGYVPAIARCESKNLFDNEWIEEEGITQRVKNGFRMVKTGNNRMGNVWEIDLPIGYYRFLGNVSTNADETECGLWIKYKDGTQQYVPYTSVFSANGWYIRSKLQSIQFYFTIEAEVGTYIEVTDFMIVKKGSEPSKYVDGGIKTIPLPLGDIKLCSTPDGTRDTFTRVNGVWNQVSNIYSEIKDGNSEVAKSATTASPYGYYFSILISKTAKYAGQEIVQNTMRSTHFKAVANHTEYYSTGCFTLSSKKDRINLFVNEEITTIDECKTWLSNNLPEFMYELETPTYTPITDQALISALDELEELSLHKGYNYITVTAVNGVKAYLDLDIPATASVTNVVETDVPHELIIPAVTGEGDVKVKIPTENRMTINPATGKVKVKELEVDGNNIKGFSKVTLWSGNLNTVNQTATLSQSLENFDYLLIKSNITNANDIRRYMPVNWIDTNDIKNIYGTDERIITDNFYDASASSSLLVYVGFNNSTTMALHSINKKGTINSYQITEVVGVKL